MGAGVKRTWRQNREDQRHVQPEAWEWFQATHLQGGNTIWLLVMAGGRHAAEIVRFFLEADRQLEAGLPYQVKVRAIFSEDLTTEEARKHVHAESRYTRFLAQRKNGDLLFQGRRFTDYVNALPKLCEETGIPLFYSNPCTDEGWEQIQTLGSGDRKPFHMTLGGPWRHWVGYRVRREAGEISFPAPTAERPHRRQLREVAGDLTYGLCFGIHPNLRGGGPEGLQHMGGSTPFDYFIAHKINEARLSLMGLGPEVMDDRRLWVLDGPVGSFGINYTGRMGEDLRHEAGAEILRKSYEWIGATLQGAPPMGRGLAAAIAQRVQVLYAASCLQEEVA